MTASLTRVVAAALVRDGAVLAASRRKPVGWEFPGGKVEPGESDAAALRRECREELGVDVSVGARLGAADGERVHIVLYAATLDAGEPEPLEDHDELRWLRAVELDHVTWLPVDRALLDAVVAHLGQ